MDTFIRPSPAIEVRQNFRGADVVEVLERISRQLGYPNTNRLDNGPEFISKELDLWAFVHGVILDFSRPGKSTDNAFIESLNGKFRAECLNANWFLSFDEIRRKCEAWRRTTTKYGFTAQSATKRRSCFIGRQATLADAPPDEARISWRRWSEVGRRFTCLPPHLHNGLGHPFMAHWALCRSRAGGFKS